MSFSENAIISIRNNGRLRRERTFLNIENNGVRIGKDHKPLSKPEQQKLDILLDKATKKRNSVIRIYYTVMIVLTAFVFGYIVAFQW